MIKIADKSKDGWQIVAEYESDELTSGSKKKSALKKAREWLVANVVESRRATIAGKKQSFGACADNQLFPVKTLFIQCLVYFELAKKVPVVNCRCYFCILSTRQESEVLDMNNIDEITQAISIGLIVANFLINTRRVLKAIELCKECLFIFDNTQLVKEEKKYKLLCKHIYSTVLLAYWFINDLTNAIKYGKKLLYILQKCRQGKEECQINITLATLYHCQREASCYGNLGAVYQSVGEYEKAKDYCLKALAIRREIGDRNGEASCYGKLGAVFRSVGEYEKARDYHMRALTIRKEMVDRNGEACCYGDLGIVFQSFEKERLAVMETSESVLKSLGEYEKAKEYLEEALAIKKEIGDREGESSCYRNLGNVFQAVGEYVKAKKYYEKELAITKEIGDRKGEGAVYGNLGAVFISLGTYAKANEYLQKALALIKEVGDRKGEAGVYGNLGIMFQSIGDYKQAREYLEKALTISKEIGDKNGEASIYGNLGGLFELLGEYIEAEESHKRALAKGEEIGDVKKQSGSLCSLGWIMLKTGKFQEALSFLLPSIQKCEDLR
ncbi:hypothetical protein ACROYT_G043485 [Oculina patagonica]